MGAAALRISAWGVGEAPTVSVTAFVEAEADSEADTLADAEAGAADTDADAESDADADGLAVVDVAAQLARRAITTTSDTIVTSVLFI
jgi:hypothetical protein